MTTRRILVQALVILFVGTVELLRPPDLVASPNASRGFRLGGNSDCEACGVCWWGECPNTAIMNSNCGYFCGPSWTVCSSCDSYEPASEWCIEPPEPPDRFWQCKPPA